MRLVALAFAVLVLLSSTEGIVIVPPVVYFLTLSLSAFMANALVSLTVFGALRGLTLRQYFGKSLFEISGLLLSAVGTLLIAIACMLLSILIVYPLDVGTAALSGALAGILFSIVKFISVFRHYRVSSEKKRRSILASILAVTVFIAFATGISAYYAIQVEKTLGGSAPEASILGEAGKNEEQNAAIPSSAKPSNSPSSQGFAKEIADTRLSGSEFAWFIPKRDGVCRITIGGFTKEVESSFSCIMEQDGKMVRSFCPIEVSVDELKQKGNLPYSATGACEDSGLVFISESGFHE